MQGAQFSFSALCRVAINRGSTYFKISNLRKWVADFAFESGQKRDKLIFWNFADEKPKNNVKFIEQVSRIFGVFSGKLSAGNIENQQVWMATKSPTLLMTKKRF